MAGMLMRLHSRCGRILGFQLIAFLEKLMDYKRSYTFAWKIHNDNGNDLPVYQSGFVARTLK